MPCILNELEKPLAPDVHQATDIRLLTVPVLPYPNDPPKSCLDSAPSPKPCLEIADTLGNPRNKVTQTLNSKPRIFSPN